MSEARTATVKISAIKFFDQWSRYTRRMETKAVITMNVVKDNEVNDDFDIITFTNGKFSEDVAKNGVYEIQFKEKTRKEYNGKPQVIVNYAKCKRCVIAPSAIEATVEAEEETTEFEF
jgi:cytoplasmic iron level regulating protein YaaA (DUF328/UPF0246 family)